MQYPLPHLDGNPKQRSKSSVNKELKLLSKIFKMARVKENPCLEIKRLIGETKRKRRLKPEEREKLITAILADDRRAHLFKIVIADLHLGLRRAELLCLTPDDIDFECGFVIVRGTKTDKEREDIREVPLNKTALSLMEELVDEARTNEWEYLFTNPKTGTRYKDLKRSFNMALKEAGITGLTFHDLRHTFASRAGDDPDVDLAALQQTLGHKDIRTTMNYTHPSRSAMMRVVEAQERENQSSGHTAVTQQKKRLSSLS
jgi:integrase